MNAIPIEELLHAHAHAHVHHTQMQALQWLTATNRTIGITYTYGLHPNAPLDVPYDSMWKREYAGGGSVVAAYSEEPGTRHIYVGILWQRRVLHMTYGPVLAVPRGYAPVEDQRDLSTHFSLEEVKRIHHQTALIELTEEMISGQLNLEMLEQLGPPVTMNNADIDTSGEGEGVYFYRIELPWSFIKPIAPGVLVLKAGLEATPAIQEGILRCQFCSLGALIEMLDNAENPAAGLHSQRLQLVGSLAIFKGKDTLSSHEGSRGIKNVFHE